MTLNPGARLGPYEISSLLGAGGMGEVYRARDTRLERTVAIKVLPAHLASNPELRQRFEREARAISALNHAHICVLHDIGLHDGTDFLVMEYLEGETLADRLRKGPLPLEQVLRYGFEIAEALDRAHRQGIVHRDLKPGNVMLTKSGTKLLDFGLAKLRGAGAPPLSELSSRPTEVKPLTAEGTLVGTLPYMSPEQLEGKEPDARTDIFALGTMLYEMATGQRAFTGKSQASLMGAILKDDPAPISKLQPLTPPALDRVVATCIAKDPDERWQNAHDLATELKWIGAAGSQAGTSGPTVAPQPLPRRLAPWILIGVLATSLALALWAPWRKETVAPRPVLRATITLPTEAPVAPAAASPLGVGRPTLALSRDGRRLVYVALSGEQTQLYLREMNESEAKPLPGTAGGHSPFFSPDGEWVGFFANGKLQKISLSGGGPQVLAPARLPFGGSWTIDDTIYYVPDDFAGVWRLPAGGGDSKIVVKDWCYWPEALPEGQGLLAARHDGGISVYSFKSGENKVLLEAGSYPRLVPTGHLVYASEGKLMAVRFDAGRMELSGPPYVVMEGIRTEEEGAAQFALSENGTLAYVAGGDSTEGSLVWVGRGGKVEPLNLPAGHFGGGFNISPDGKFLALQIKDAGRGDVWLYDFDRGTPSRFTSDTDSYGPAWTPDGEWIVYSSQRSDGEKLFRKRSDGSGQEEELSNGAVKSISFFPDGKTLTFYRFDPTTGFDLWITSLDGSREPSPFLRTPFTEALQSVSPDGRWIAYTSDETGRWEVYVVPYPGPGRKLRISSEGGEEPIWARSGQEIFYRFGSKWMSVPVTTGAGLTVGQPRMLFEGPYINVSGFSYAVSPDAQRFLVIKGDQQQVRATQINVVVNWFEEMNRLMASRQQ